jgi:hypothetical protein
MFSENEGGSRKNDTIFFFSNLRNKKTNEKNSDFPSGENLF